MPDKTKMASPADKRYQKRKTDKSPRDSVPKFCCHM